MKVEPINPPGLNTSGALSQGTRAGDWIFVSGQRARDSVGLIIGAGDFEAQADRAFECMAQVLAEAGADLSDVVKLTAYLVSALHVERFHDMCARVFPTHPPAGTTAVVASLTSPDALIEIEACARLGQNTKWLTQRTGPFSTGVRTGNTIFISGQTAASRQGQEPLTEFSSQLHTVYQNLDASLTYFGAGFSDLVKINYFITNPLYYRELYRIREEVFEVDWAGDSVVSIRALDAPHTLVETDAVALAPPSKAEFVNSPKLPPPFNFSNVVVADGLAYVSGQVARDKDKNLVLPGDFDAQFRQALKNVAIALDSVGCSFENAVKVSCFLSHAGYFEESLNIRREVFKGRPSAVTSVAVDSMGGFPEALCEIDAIAAVP